jgi:hypothetical protein
MRAPHPRRLQRTRTRPLPPGVVCVTRPGRWGNPYRVEDHGRAEAVALFRQYVLGDAALLAAVRRELRGRDLACWCRPAELCHADVLLELANPKPEPQGDQLGLFALEVAQ